MTVKELEAKVAHLEALVNKQADVIGELFDAIAKLEQRPQRAAPAAPVTASKEARVAAIKRLAARFPDRKSFTPAEVNAELSNVTE